MAKTIRTVVTATLVLIIGIGSAMAGSAKTQTKAGLNCGIKVTIVAFASATPREVQFCKFTGTVQGREEFIAGCSDKFVVDGKKFTIEGTPNNFGILTMNLDAIAPVAMGETEVQIASSETLRNDRTADDTSRGGM